MKINSFLFCTVATGLATVLAVPGDPVAPTATWTGLFNGNANQVVSEKPCAGFQQSATGKFVHSCAIMAFKDNIVVSWFESTSATATDVVPGTLVWCSIPNSGGDCGVGNLKLHVVAGTSTAKEAIGFGPPVTGTKGVPSLKLLGRSCVNKPKRSQFVGDDDVEILKL